MTGHRRDAYDRDHDEVSADRFAWLVIGLVAVASLVALALLATNRWPT